MPYMIRAATVAVLLSFAASDVLWAQADHGAHHGGAAPAAEAAASYAEGTVKKVDKGSSKLTIAHGPLASVGMPAMTMAFPVVDPAMLDQAKAGDKVRFKVDNVNGVLTITTLEVAP